MTDYTFDEASYDFTGWRFVARGAADHTMAAIARTLVRLPPSVREFALARSHARLGHRSGEAPVTGEGAFPY